MIQTPGESLIPTGSLKLSLQGFGNGFEIQNYPPARAEAAASKLFIFSQFGILTKFTGIFSLF